MTTTKPTDAVSILRDALQKITETRFGYDGDCGVTRIAEDALYEAERAAIQPAGDVQRYTNNSDGTMIENPDGVWCYFADAFAPAAPVQAAPDAGALGKVIRSAYTTWAQKNHDVAYGTANGWFGFAAGARWAMARSATDAAPAVQAASVGDILNCLADQWMYGNSIDLPMPAYSSLLKLIGSAPEVKASELPPLPSSFAQLPRLDGTMCDAYTPNQMHAYLRADRAARSPVAAPQPDKMGTGEWTSADDTYMLKREIHNLKRHIEDYCAPGKWESAVWPSEVKASELPSIGDDVEFQDLLNFILSDCMEYSERQDSIERIVAGVDARLSTLLAARSPVAAPQPDVSARDLAFNSDSENEPAFMSRTVTESAEPSAMDAAHYIDRQAEAYLQENARADYDTGATEWKSDACRDHYYVISGASIDSAADATLPGEFTSADDLFLAMGVDEMSIAALERDAGRYRALRLGNDYAKDGPMVLLYEKASDPGGRPYWSIAGEVMDAAIDAAIAALQPEGAA